MKIDVKPTGKKKRKKKGSTRYTTTWKRELKDEDNYACNKTRKAWQIHKAQEPSD